jgi:hypothetical protein
MPSTIKDIISFRGSKLHSLMLKSAPYKRHKGKLLRLLLDAYFNNELPGLKYKFEKEIGVVSNVPRTGTRDTIN